MTILKQHPKVTALIKQWLLKDMKNSLDKDQKEIPADLKPAIEELASSNERIIKIIEEHPRSLFDLLDEHEIYIDIYPNFEKEKLKGFHVSINAVEGDLISYSTRKQAEKEAILEAFKLLEEKL